ncbi:hypothetical protein Adeh_2105 [Anaeromyxobacter dehalogenans 2CP-C]|uniref:Uncharacterized protein n=1 Tax=Anaeromyxobacter dehalogenans (strain 2CP-C) TaxID=290397 RepID=Q2IJP7_ANADE|nr:hypothetical protein Adeh_2105 [Anaeromyxobacter dehalogenans 2CP-C]
MRVEAPDPGARRNGARPWSPVAPAWVIVGALVLAASGCQRESVSHFRVPKSAPAPEPAGMAAMPAGMGGGMGAPGMAGDVPPPAQPTGSSALAWTLPKGWNEVRGGGAMRYATITPPASGGKVEVTVIVLPGPAGGELANVNRWRGQIGLPPLDDAALASARKHVKTRAGDVSVYDFLGEGQQKTRVVAGFTFTEGNTWFLKMSGDASAVGARKPEFVSLLESLRLDAN